MELQPCEIQAQRIRVVDMGGQTSGVWRPIGGAKGLQCLSTALQGLLAVMVPLGCDLLLVVCSFCFSLRFTSLPACLVRLHFSTIDR